MAKRYTPSIVTDVDVTLRTALTCLPAERLSEAIAAIEAADLKSTTKSQREHLWRSLDLMQSALAMRQYQDTVAEFAKVPAIIP